METDQNKRRIISFRDQERWKSLLRSAASKCRRHLVDVQQTSETGGGGRKGDERWYLGDVRYRERADIETELLWRDLRSGCYGVVWM
jgi:hypothetical protein